MEMKRLLLLASLLVLLHINLCAQTSRSQGIYLSCLTFYGEYLAFDFNAQLMDLFTFGTYGGILLDGESYG